MAYTLGKPRPPTSGRKKGTGNKKTEEVIEILRRNKFDPVQELISLYQRTDSEERTVAVAGRLLTEILQYVYPKRRAIEHSGIDGAAIQIDVNQEFGGKSLLVLQAETLHMLKTLQETPAEILKKYDG